MSEEKPFSFSLAELRELFERADRMTFTHLLTDKPGGYGRLLNVCVIRGEPDQVVFEEQFGNGRGNRRVTYPVSALFELFPLLQALTLRLSKIKFQGEPDEGAS